MRPLVGLDFAGATLTEHDDFVPGSGRLGRPVWGSSALLANLELRLGLPTPEVSEAVRVQRWSRRLADFAASAPKFYSRSYEVDPVGTAATILSWRDALVDAGWNGELISGGGERLEVLSALEGGASVPPGSADRLWRVEQELCRVRTRPFDEVHLAEPRDVWSGRWQRVFASLEERGTPVRTVEPTMPVFDADTDLGRLQARLRGAALGEASIAGDGTLVALRAETSSELAQGLAAMLRAANESSSALIRGGEIGPLEYALAAQGLASQGFRSASEWRPALQILSLAIELAFEPRDPHRVLELLTLPTGPFQGFVGSKLASALADAPGIGGRLWRKTKEEIARELLEWAIRDARARGGDEVAAQRAAEADAKEKLERVAEWFEQPGHDQQQGAPRAALLATADRVRAWLKRRVAAAYAAAGDQPENAELAREAALLSVAYRQAQAFHEALSHEPRGELDLVATRQLVEDVSLHGHALTLSVERAGRIDPVDHPASLRCVRDQVVWWYCVDGTQWRPATQPWRKAEVEALRAAGVSLPDPAKRLAVQTNGWRRAILAARKRLILAIPRSALGETLESHPIFDEIVARLRLDTAAIGRISIDVRDLLSNSGPSTSVAVPELSDLEPLALPEARPLWKIEAEKLEAATVYSASGLEALVGCPLQWVLRYRARLRAGSIAAIPDGPLLNGKLGHRLVEELHNDAALLDGPRLDGEVHARLDRLLREEAAVLLRPGMAFELAQLRKQIVYAVRALADLLVGSGLEVRAVETVERVAWGARELEGRLDLLLRDGDDRDVVIDLKWGRSSYFDLLRRGLAIQLAIYAAARRLATGAPELPAAAYFSLSRGELLVTEIGPFAGVRPLDGPRLSETWAKLERTVLLVEKALARGEVPVTGVSRSLPLLDSVGVRREEAGAYVATEPEAACRYCSYSALCGRKWEGFAS